MTTYSEKVGGKLNDLLEKTYDAEKGFKKAADNVKHSGLKNYFNQKAQERHDFGYALKAEIKSFGQPVDNGGSITGTMHRAWMDVKSVLSKDNEESMLEEAIRGEEATVEEYNDVLSETTLPPSTQTILTQQKNKIMNGLSSIRRLEDLN
ncbi:ferritin-like domain-containing protein [Aquimarina spongiae]|uniref:DUF2383 domain-containing protein n=1 Tax=Aquimarina spongiae TaxID=570521 RepID=A0A1M6GMA4_9FLAO|nr:PA2169 family four-helix-bundle protein [Aquimarina spongiae]SHJ11042.1 conserved hypothetical protein [Aquimarina spongiae]